mmetsp:Transcript_42780/g.97109  ORF Transcript_42780/g.97109 Transcript_42780/m.97109 type:complete len:323 (-) Transcript_42780:931-1899(-)
MVFLKRSFLPLNSCGILMNMCSESSPGSFLYFTSRNTLHPAPPKSLSSGSSLFVTSHALTLNLVNSTISLSSGIAPDVCRAFVSHFGPISFNWVGLKGKSMPQKSPTARSLTFFLNSPMLVGQAAVPARGKAAQRSAESGSQAGQAVVPTAPGAARFGISQPCMKRGVACSYSGLASLPRSSSADNLPSAMENCRADLAGLPLAAGVESRSAQVLPRKAKPGVRTPPRSLGLMASSSSTSTSAAAVAAKTVISSASPALQRPWAHSPFSPSATANASMELSPRAAGAGPVLASGSWPFFRPFCNCSTIPAAASRSRIKPACA